MVSLIPALVVQNSYCKVCFNFYTFVLCSVVRGYRLVSRQSYDIFDFFVNYKDQYLSMRHLDTIFLKYLQLYLVKLEIN